MNVGTSTGDGLQPGGADQPSTRKAKIVGFIDLAGINCGLRPGWLDGAMADARPHHAPGDILNYVKGATDTATFMRRLAACVEKEANLRFPRFYATEALVDLIHQAAQRSGFNSSEVRDALVVMAKALARISEKSADCQWSVESIRGFRHAETIVVRH